MLNGPQKIMKNSKIRYWLVKSEPDVWSIDQQIKSGAKGATWDGVRNYQAANNEKKLLVSKVC
jgi:predicted RNA-binding protein with PUA-like domain